MWGAQADVAMEILLILTQVWNGLPDYDPAETVAHESQSFELQAWVVPCHVRPDVLFNFICQVKAQLLDWLVCFAFVCSWAQELDLWEPQKERSLKL